MAELKSGIGEKEMELIKCGDEQLDLVSDMYSSVVKHLEETVNYPKWSKNYPCKESVMEAIQKGEQYACVENGAILGVVVLNDNPDGNYAAGRWSKELRQGEYLVIHTLAVNPAAGRRGVGEYMVDCCIEIALREGYQAIRIDVVPNNIPAINLYKRKGFIFAGVKDLLRNIEDIPLFELYELNFDTYHIKDR